MYVNFNNKNCNVIFLRNIHNFCLNILAFIRIQNRNKVIILKRKIKLYINLKIIYVLLLATSHAFHCCSLKVLYWEINYRLVIDYFLFQMQLFSGK